jgi:hypothetical protein
MQWTWISWCLWFENCNVFVLLVTCSKIRCRIYAEKQISDEGALGWTSMIVYLRCILFFCFWSGCQFQVWSCFCFGPHRISGSVTPLPPRPSMLPRFLFLLRRRDISFFSGKFLYLCCLFSWELATSLFKKWKITTTKIFHTCVVQVFLFFCALLYQMIWQLIIC